MTQRTPLIAGNWKMHKTVAEAEEFVAGPAAAGLERRGRRRRDLRAVHRAAGRASTRPAARASRSTRRTCTRPSRAPSPARSAPPMLAELDVARRACSATPSAASTSARPTGRWPRRSPPRSTPASRPILCVGETEEERERGDTERKLRHQVQEGLESVARRAPRRRRRSPTSRSGRSAPGKVRDARAGAGGDRLRPRARRRPRPRAGRAHADPLRRQRQARRTPPSCSRCPTSTARWSAAPRWSRRRSRRSSRPRSGSSRPCASRSRRSASSILDGWGLAAPGPGNAVSLADTPVFDDLWERYPHTQLTACGEAVGLPEGQMGNSEVGHLNLGAGAVVKQDLTRIDEAVEDGSLAENEVLRGRDGRRRARPPHRAGRATAACTRGPKPPARR